MGSRRQDEHRQQDRHGKSWLEVAGIGCAPRTWLVAKLFQKRHLPASGWLMREEVGHHELCCVQPSISIGQELGLEKRRLRGDLTNVCKNLKRIVPDSSWQCQVIG